MEEEKIPQHRMLIAHLGLIILSSITVWPTSHVSCHEYRNYPIQVHQMFQERTQFGLKSSDRVRGNWGGWAAWSDCSRSCGTGIQSQARECLPASGHSRKRSVLNDVDGIDKLELKPLCVGIHRRYHVCNTQECPNFGDYRTEQCAKYNGKFYKGQSYQWEPFPDAPNDCALNCRAVGERFYATLEPEVLDGTPCRGISRGRTRVPGVLAVGAADHWLCVSGQCKPVGCDGVVGSGRILDACGVCGGEGNSCRLFEGIFLEPKLSKGYQLVTTIPKGAISLNISEVRPSRNSLALRDSNSSFLLNGPSSVSPPGVYGGAGASFSYHRGDAVHPENIWANGPLGEPVDLMILSEDMNPGVLYKYMLPLNEKIDDSAMLAPPLLVAGPNDKIGNEIPELFGPPAVPKTPDIQSKEETAKSSQGVRKGNNKRRDDKSGMTKMAGDQPMQQTRLVAKERRKKKNNKKFFWKISGLSPCSKACGGGVQHATFKCFRESTKAMAPERRCKRVPRPASPPPLSCNTLPCPARWRAGPWSPCSVTCGTGTQVRKLECVQELNPKLTMRVAPGACIEKSDLKTTMTCKSNPCTSTRAPEARQMQSQIEDTSTSTESQWTTGPWGTCSSTCGSGIRKRQVTCITAGADTCPPDTKPSNQTNCDGLPECTDTIEPKAPWLFTDWSSQCSTDCGIGYKTRQVACNDGNEVFCDATKKPSLTESCAGNGTDCDKIRYQWFVGAWSPCTVSCGSGIRRRDVVCLASVKDDLKISEEKNCGKLTRPLAEERCLTPACPAEWFTSDWSECSTTCGIGLQTRVVRCLREGVETSDCSNLTEPKKSQVCDNNEFCKSDVSENPVKPPKKVYEKTDCVDKFPNCNLVVKAGVCRMKYYKHSCCSCRD